MNPLDIIKKYYIPNTPIYRMLTKHSESVANKALQIARNHPELHADENFIWEASMLHDIGIYLTYAPEIHCYGTEHYLAHGYLGHNILLTLHLPRHALVCERHTGTGLNQTDIISQNLPLPIRDMSPQSIEEQIICFADCFFSKSNLLREKSIEQVRHDAKKWGEKSLVQFDKWCSMFL